MDSQGWFYAEVDGLGRSYTFQLGPQVARELFSVITNGLYMQRCGTALVSPWAGDWPRPVSHNELYLARENVVHPWELEVDPHDPASGVYYDPDGPHPIRGGHHDAGDYDTRLTHLAVGEKLMTLFEARPGLFKDGQSFIPEAGNGMPDLLDEVAWSLLHYTMLQDYFGESYGDFGAVPPGMESTKHPPVAPVPGDGDPLNYYMRKATPYTTYCGAAAFAQAARIFSDFDPEKSKDFARRARAAYDWAEAHREQSWDPENPHVMRMTWEEAYDAGKLDAAQAWAAAHLYLLTQDEAYWRDWNNRIDSATETAQGHKWNAIFPLLLTKHAQADAPRLLKWRQAFLNAADADLAVIEANGHQGYQALCRNKGDWGHANPIDNIEVIAKAWLLTGRQDYRDAVATAVDFTLGMNPSEMSWMTGVGSVHVMDPLHANSKYDGIIEPVPGIVIFGPTEVFEEDQNPLYPDPEHMGFYRRMSDVWGYVRACEYVVDQQQANMALAAGVLLDD